MLLIKSFGRLASTNVFKASSSAINIKDSCLNKLKQIIDKPQEEFLRISVETGGCSGFSYLFEIDNKPIDTNEELVFERENYKIVVNKEILPYMKGAAVEYNESLMKSSFHVVNPVAETKCSCGTSFSIDFNKLTTNN